MKTKLAYVMMCAGAAVALAALSMVVGCGSGSDSLPFSELQSSVITAACRYNVLCQAYPDQATCVASAQTQPHLFDTLGVDIMSGKVIYDGVAARACVDAINSLSSCPRNGFSMLNARTAVCNKVFTGTIAVGGACFFSEECVGGGDCLTTGNCASSYQCCAGTCQTPPVSVPVGGDCSVYGPSACPAGTSCLTDANSGKSTCRAPIGVGGSCSTSPSCAAGLYCDVTFTHTCKPQKATGGTCDPAVSSQDCSGPQDVCDSTTQICTPPSAVGSPCGGAQPSCVGYAMCDPTSLTCVERPTVGAACDPTLYNPCLGGNCDATSATCVLPPSGGACS